MVAATPLSIDQLPAEMIAAVEVEAARDADRVIQFLTEVGLGATPEKPRSMPASFLLHLGAGLRLLAWEAQGFFLHRDAGLPDANRAIRDAFRLVNEPNGKPTELHLAVLHLSVERFSWSGPPDLGADVVLEEAQEDALLESLADFLWTNGPRQNTGS